MKVGDYVRYKYEDCIYIGRIGFISEVMGFDETLQFEIDNCIEEILKQDIIKSSPNIIDLIEVGDILSFKDKSICRVLEITDNGYYLLKDFGGEQYYESKEYINELKSIVAKEQFENMEYKL